MENRKVAVMQVIDNLDIGGAQEVLCTLVKHLAAHNCRPIVCTFKDGPLRQDIERSGVYVEVLTGRHYSVMALPLFVIDMVRIWRALAKLVKKHKVDVVQTHLLGSLDFLILLLRYTTPLRVVLWTFHITNFELTASQLPKYRWMLGPKKLSHRLLYRLTSRLVDGFIAVSGDVKKAMLEIIGPIGDKVTVICNGVDTQKYRQTVDKRFVRNHLGLAADTRLIALVATLKEQKGHRYLIEALTSIVPQHPDVHVLFIGDGPLRGELQLQVERLHLDGHIHFLGSRRDVPELLAASDLFVLPSLWEGLAMALLEAMATGLPVVASEVSGTVQVITPSESGILVPPGDTQPLAQAIEQLLNDSMLAQTMGVAAKRRVEEKFSAQKQADEHLALYRRFLRREAGTYLD